MNHPHYVPIHYREFSDIPRIFTVRDVSGLYLFDCPFDNAIDEYPSEYWVYRLPAATAIPDTGSWDHLSRGGVLLARIPTSDVTFDETKRVSIDARILALLSNTG